MKPACEGEVGTCSQINEYMMIYDNPRSMSFIVLCPRSLRFNIFKLLFLKKHQAIEATFQMEPPWDVGNETLFIYSRSHDQDGFQAHISGVGDGRGQELKHLLLLNQEANDLEMLYTTSGAQVHVLPNLFK